MNAGEESDNGVVPMKRSNKSAPALAESVEGRPLIKENIMEQRTFPTPSGDTDVLTKLQGVRRTAKEKKQERFTALLHHVTVDLLRESFRGLKKQAAPGVDGVTWEEYEQGLEDRLIDNKGRVKTYFDKLYRVTQTRTNDPDGEFAVDTEYDGNGRVKKTSNPYRISGGSAIWTQTAYDALSRPSTVTAPDSATVQYAYANNQTTTTDQAGNQRRYTYNVLGQLTKVEEPSPSLYTPVITTYKYYGFGPLYQSSQSSQTRTWVYNWIGQMTSQTLPESGTTSFAYDSGGRLSTKTDARSVVTTMAYDNANRVTQRSYSDSTPTVGFTYDQSSQTGLRTAMSDGLGSVAYTYDTMDRLTQESRTLTGISGTFSTSYVYNVKGDVTQMTYPTGRVVNFGYATGGGCCNSRLSSVADGTTSTTLLNSIAFNAAGGVTGQTLNPGSNAIAETFTYNNRLQLTQIQAVKGSTTVMDFSYDYGTSSTNTGRVLKRTDALQPEHSANYVYDSLYRLAQAVGVDSTWGISWALDTWGNRTSQTPTGLATSKVGSQTIGYSSNKNTSHTYDSAGNTTNDTVHTYAFNAENQQTSMDGGAATYGYDGEGRRMKKYTSSETTYTFYGPGGILCEYTTTNTGATAAASTDKTIYRTSEKTGTAVMLFNTSGTVIENNRTLPYGEAWLSDVASANDKKFTTYDRDKESGLDYAMNRMYANTGGRFTSVDKGPMSLPKPSTLNRYAYGGLDPINNQDPSGNMYMGSVGACEAYGGVVTGIYMAWLQLDWVTWKGMVETSERYSADWVDGVECGNPPALSPEAYYTGAGERQSGGGGGRAHAEAQGPARGYIQAAIDNIVARFNAGGFGADCAKTLSAMGTSMGTLVSRISTTQVFDGTTSALWASNLLTGDVPQFLSMFYPAGNVTIAQWFSAFGVQAMADVCGNRIFVNPGMFQSGDLSWNAATVLHELIHNVTGKIDQILQVQLFALGGVSFNTGNITQKIKDDCFK